MASTVLPFRIPPPRQEALAEVRRRAEDTRNIWWSEHARTRMVERDISQRQALRTIEEDNVHDKIVPDGDDEWKVILKKQDAGRTVHVVVALAGHNDLTVITVY